MFLVSEGYKWFLSVVLIFECSFNKMWVEEWGFVSYFYIYLEVRVDF